MENPISSEEDSDIIRNAVDVLQKRFEETRSVIYNTYDIKNKNQSEITDDRILKLQSDNNQIWAVIMILNKFYTRSSE